MLCIDHSTSEAEILKLLLKNRQISKKDTDSFLKPINPQKLEPKDFGVNSKSLCQTVEIIQDHIKKGSQILIYGDYDVDGITATAIIWQVLYQQGAKVLPFVPDRETDGYGIKADSFFRIQSDKNLHFDLLITVDNGIVAGKELEKILKSGTQIVVIDHHVANDSISKEISVVHSTLTSGSVLSWLVASQIDKSSDLGLAALGAVTDCMPLNTVNRNIVYHGIQFLRLQPNPGIKKLIQSSGSKQDSLTTYDLGFILGPRINAVGRLSNPTDALRLLCSQTPQQANKFVAILDDYNKERQTLQQESLILAEKNINPKDKLLFVADNSFHPGVIGLIAGRLTEKYYLPSIAISIDNEISKGSCRSIKELNIIETLREFSELFIDLGGHAGAAGFSIKTENIPKIQQKLTKFINQKLANCKLKPEKFIDAEMKLNAVTVKNCRLIKKLEPFGIGNPDPVFLFKQVRVVEKRLLGSTGDHLKLKIDDPTTPQKENIIVDSIAFKKGEFDSKIKVGDFIDFTANLSLNIWNGYTSPQLVVKDFLS
jgi:single-stranded-DNA-specific exonuclease